MVVYKIQNKLDGKCYVGQTTVGIETRIKGHKKPNTKCRLISRAIQKSGIDNFTVIKLEDVREIKMKLREKETTKDDITRLAQQYEISSSTIYSIKYGRNWKEVI